MMRSGETANGDPRSARAATAEPPADAIVKRSITIAGHRTGISLEAAFWAELRRLATEAGRPLANLVAEIDATRTGNLSSAIRVWVLQRVHAAADREGAPPPAQG